MKQVNYGSWQPACAACLCSLALLVGQHSSMWDCCWAWPYHLLGLTEASSRWTVLVTWSLNVLQSGVHLCQESVAYRNHFFTSSLAWPYSRTPGNYAVILPLGLPINSTGHVFPIPTPLINRVCQVILTMGQVCFHHSFVLPSQALFCSGIYLRLVAYHVTQ